MRRQDRRITERSEIEAILSRETVCRIAFAVDGEPYIVPLSYGYDAQTHALVFHMATEGRKIDCMEANPRVCFEIEGPTELISTGADACGWSIRYESLIGYGTLTEVSDPDAKLVALRCLMRQQSGQDLDWTFSEKHVAVTRIWRLEIESIEGKRANP